MKRTLSLIALLATLTWAMTYELPTGGDLAAFAVSRPLQAINPTISMGLSLQNGGAERTGIDCKSDNPQVAGFQELQTKQVTALCLWSLPQKLLNQSDRSTRTAESVHTSLRPVGEPESAADSQRWPGGMARLRVRGGEEGTTDYGSAVCVGFGRTPGEWTFLSCSHNFESGGEPELQLAGQWVPATLLYRDKLAEAVETAPGQYTRVESGPDRSVLVVQWEGRLRYRPVSLERWIGDVALSGYPSTPRPVTIAGQTEEHASAMKAALQRPSQGGYSGGGVFNLHQELIGIWTSGAQGSGYGHYVFEFLPIFRQLGWAPGNWQLTQDKLARHE